MTDKIDELKENPVFAMSLGGKELFHSNILDFRTHGTLRLCIS